MSAATKNPASPKTYSFNVTTPGDTEIRIERVFNAPRERVWKAYTTPEHVAQWWGAGDHTDVEEMDFVDGGRWRYVTRGKRGTHTFFGHYKKITPIERIELTFAFDEMKHEGDCVVEFHDLGNGTTLLVDRSLVGSKAGVEGILQTGMLDGADMSFAALERVLATMEK